MQKIHVKNNDIKNKYKIVTKQLNKQKISINLSVNLLKKTTYNLISMYIFIFKKLGE
jgi:hypothetical protein